MPHYLPSSRVHVWCWPFGLMFYHQLRSYGDGTLDGNGGGDVGWILHSALIQSVISVHVLVARS